MRSSDAKAALRATGCKPHHPGLQNTTRLPPCAAKAALRARTRQLQDPRLHNSTSLRVNPSEAKAAARCQPRNMPPPTRERCLHSWEQNACSRSEHSSDEEGAAAAGENAVEEIYGLAPDENALQEVYDLFQEQQSAPSEDEDQHTTSELQAVNDVVSTTRLSYGAVQLGDWMLGHDVSLGAVNELLQHVLPATNGAKAALSGLPENARQVLWEMGQSLSGHVVKGETRQVVVCRGCGFPAARGVAALDDRRMCAKCPSRQKHVLQYTHWPLVQQIQARVRVPALARHLLDHCSEVVEEDDTLVSERYEALRSSLGEGPLHCGLVLHCDGWCPIETRPTHSCTYILVEWHVGPGLRCSREGDDTH